MSDTNAGNARRVLQLVYEQLCRGGRPSARARSFLLRLAEIGIADDQAETLLTCLGLLADPAAAPMIERYLHRDDAPQLATEALWTLCRMGLAPQYKDYILRAVEPGYPWDVRDRLRTTALHGAAAYLKDHRDPDFAHMIAKLAGRTDDPLLRTHSENHAVSTAQIAAGIAMGADPAALTDDDALREASVARFLAERQDG